MHLQLNTNHLQTIKNHAQTTYPDECSGLILDYISSEYKTVVEVIPSYLQKTPGIGKRPIVQKKHRVPSEDM
jgi:proteasome lid subunit RPN8/RPN11